MIVVGWEAPLLDGGCPVLGYELYRNDGASDALETIVDSVASDNPSLSTATIDLSEDGNIGSIYKFKVRATNYAGTQDSSALSVALASLPAQPQTPPTSNPDITGQDRIGVEIEAFDGTMDGGSPILVYNIQYDDGNRGDYRDIYSLSPAHTIPGVEGGAQYRFRYRARNFNGWGPFSEVRYILAATVPDAPDAPLYKSSTLDSITFGFVPPSDNGGSIVSSYQLYYDVISSSPDY